ncbi:MAG: GNAT family N-acetyltransferase [Clostridium sp.]|nr:GNAT family N-acetyltransferase [Clostridium sp.]
MLSYKKATIDDLEFLVETRIEVLRAANNLDKSVDMTVIKEQSYDYYKKSLSNKTHIAYLVFDGEKFVGAGGISFFRVMPTFNNPSGNKAYIMNMYTSPSYRRKGIAYKTLDLLVLSAKERGISSISLEATEMGRPLYEKYGFIKMNDEMELPIR